MELRHLRYFVAVAEELNFTRAAERLYIAQPPLSTQIRALEEELKVQLFDRDKRRVHLTQAGRHLLERARTILVLVQDAKEEARSAGAGDIGKISLGFTASSMLALPLPTGIQKFRASYPLVSVTLNEMTSLEQLDAIHGRTLDAGILRRPEVVVPAGVTVREWYTTPLVAAIPKTHPLSRAALVSMHDLEGEPLVMYPRASGIGLYWKVHDLCAKAGFRATMAQEARDSSTIIGLVAAGIGIAIVPADTQCIRLPGVVYQPLQDKDAVSTLHLAHREADENPFIAVLLSVLDAVSPRNTAAAV